MPPSHCIRNLRHSTKFPQTSTAPAVATAPNRSKRGSSCFPSCPCNASDACKQPVKDLRVLFGPDHSDFCANACFSKYCIEHHGPIDLERLCCRLMDVKLGVVEAPSCFPPFPKAMTFMTRTLWHPSRTEAPKVARLQRWGRA